AAVEPLVGATLDRGGVRAQASPFGVDHVPGAGGTGGDGAAGRDRLGVAVEDDVRVAVVHDGAALGAVDRVLVAEGCGVEIGPGERPPDLVHEARPGDPVGEALGVAEMRPVLDVPG